MSEETTVATETTETSQAAEASPPAVETWHDPAKVLRVAFWARVTAYIFLVLIFVTVLIIGWDIISRAHGASAMDLLRSFVGQYVGFASLFMAVFFFLGLAHILEILLDIEENTRTPKE